LTPWIGGVSCGCLALAFPLAAVAQTIELRLPIDCEVGRTCVIQHYVDRDPSANAQDYQCGTLTYDGHNGTDFRLPTTAIQRAGIDVLAAAEGRVQHVRDGMPDISVSTPSAPSVDDRECGNGVIIAHADGWESQYCHMALGSLRVKPGEFVRPGQPIGRVGLSGRTEFPHLHFTVRLRGQVVDPFAFGAPEGACGGGVTLWSAGLRASLAYRAPAILNTGFANAPVTMGQIESGEAGQEAPALEASALVAFVRAIGLKAGDLQQLWVRTPDGRMLAEHSEKPLERNKAQSMLYVGKKRPPSGWPAGTYQATYRIVREGKVVLEQVFAVSF
jgi:hypothetical protein